MCIQISAKATRMNASAIHEGMHVLQCSPTRPLSTLRLAPKPPTAARNAQAIPLRWKSTPHMQLRSYAAISATVSLSVDEAARSIAEPQVLAGCRNVQLEFPDWPKWDWNSKPYDTRCHSKLSHVLGALDSSPYVGGVFLSLADTLALPLPHLTPFDDNQRTPVTILGSIAIHVQPVDLGAWILPDYSSTEIGDPVLTRILQRARTYGRDADAWERVVADSGPSYQAFDYTASFHAVSLSLNHGETPEEMPVVDFGPYGPEKYRTGDLDRLSVDFADDFAKNTLYFERGSHWHPRLFEELRREGRGSVRSSKLYGHGKGNKDKH